MFLSFHNALWPSRVGSISNFFASGILKFSNGKFVGKFVEILGIWFLGIRYSRLVSITVHAPYKPRLVFFFTQFSIQLRLILQTIYVLKTEILHFLSLKSAAYKRERLQIESGLWWRAYGIWNISGSYVTQNAMPQLSNLFDIGFMKLSLL